MVPGKMRRGASGLVLPGLLRLGYVSDAVPLSMPCFFSQVWEARVAHSGRVRRACLRGNTPLNAWPRLNSGGWAA
ncbi:hypothetical protein LZ30DRAFT_738127 [Colletotrichum cereale]|nr:hypothetical protein LZ30DRAFT_738127 [Colletotrichum cereale]